jgi:hypothetical protein
LNRRAIALASGLAAAGGLAFAAYWFEPWKLFVDARVADAAPIPAASSVRVVASGNFRSLEHDTKGTAKVLELADRSRLLRFEDLVTSNGPELVVMLSATPATENGWSAYDDGAHLILEPLKGNLGSQNYAIPNNVDLARYKSAVVWCRRFSVAFGAAPLE